MGWRSCPRIHLVEKSNLEHATAVHLTSALEASELERFRRRLKAACSHSPHPFGAANTRGVLYEGNDYLLHFPASTAEERLKT
jgi:hypothetical protein